MWICPTLAVLFLPAVARLYAGPQWIGVTKERFSREGIGKVRVFSPPPPRTVTLDIDRDGDVDLLRIFSGRRRGLIECLRRETGEKLLRTWRADISRSTGGSITAVYVARLSESPWPDLVLSLSETPYLAVFRSERKGRFTPRATYLQRSFPTPFYPPGKRLEPYLRLRAILDYNGDGYEDLVIEARDASLAKGQYRVRLHGLYVLCGGKAPLGRSKEILDLARLGQRATVGALSDFDGDGTVEMILTVQHLRTAAISVKELLFLRKAGRLLQEASWTVSDWPLGEPAAKDLNGDSIADLLFPVLQRASYLVLLSRRRRAGTFTYRLETLSASARALSPAGGPINVFFDDLNADKALDFFSVAGRHNQVHVALHKEGRWEITERFLPLLPQAAPRKLWFEKALYFGDADGDGQKELLVLTNQILNPRFVPPAAEGGEEISPDTAVLPIVRAGAERTRYAPYHRLLLYGVTAETLFLRAVYNTTLSAPGTQPLSVSVHDVDTDGKRELTAEVRYRESGRRAQAVFEFTGRLPGRITSQYRQGSAGSSQAPK